MAEDLIRKAFRFGEKLFCYIVWLNLALFTDLWYNEEKKGGIDINENNERHMV